MTHGNGHDSPETAPGNGHGGDHAHQAPPGVIPESSLQDKLLQMVAVLALIALLVAGWQWSQSGQSLSTAPAGTHQE